MSGPVRSSALELLPRAAWSDVLRGEAVFVGARVDRRAPRGVVSPIEARLALGIHDEDLAGEERRRLLEPGFGSTVRAIIGAAVATLLGGPPTAVGGRPFIVSASVDAIRVEDALAALFGATPEGRARVVHFVHAHALNVATFDPVLRSTLAAADLLLPDGIGLRVAARMLGTSIVHNVNGTDLLPAICKTSVERAIPLVLVGSAPGVAEDCAARLRASHPGLSIPIVSHGFLDDAVSEVVAGRIAALGRCVVLVGMGTPRQELWARRWLAALPEVTALTVGGLFDFYAERIPRAPVLLRELGGEWLFRLAQEPRRLAARYLLGNPLFLALVVMQRLRRTGSRPGDETRR